MSKSKEITLGSLFDGIGGFPYAGSFFGIKPLWASEIMPQAVSVTMRHLPEMEHKGDITELDGGKLPPVDIITFGSPCQDLSVAGKRAGLGGERSGLFAEAIRIIDEMRSATNGKYPRYAVWENVPGALSSSAGIDFKAVLESFTKTEIPVPRSGVWANAGVVRGNGVDIAWCVYNAQHFGVPQRRRRIFLVCDFGGGSAGEILFIPKSLSGYFETCGAQGQVIAADAQSGTGSAGIPAGINDTAGTLDANYGKGPGMRSGVERDVILCAATGQSNAEILENLSSTLNCNCEQPIIYKHKSEYLTPWDVQSQRIHAEEGRWPALYGCDGGGRGYAAQSKKSDTNCLTPWDTQQSRVFAEDGLSPTLAGADGGGGRNPGGLVFAAFLGGASAKARSIGYSEEVSPTLKGEPCGFSSPCVCEPNLARTLTARGDGSPNADSGPNIVAVGVHQNQNGDISTAETAYTLATNGNATGRNAPLVCENIKAFSLDSAESNSMKSSNPHSGCRETETARTLDTATPCPSKNQGGIAVVDQPVICAATSQANAEISEEICPTITGAAGTSGNNKPYIVHPDISGTLVASGAGLSRPGGMASETDLCVAYCLQGNMIGRKDKNGPLGSGVNEEISYTVNSTDVNGVAALFNRQRSDYFKENNIAGTQTARQCKDSTDLICESQPDERYINTGTDTPDVASVDCRNYKEQEEISGTLQSKTQGYSLNYQNPVRSGYIVRRLLPVECERLQGYPDGWTQFGHDGREISDTRRYQMLGNSVAVPCVAYILLGIAEQFGKAAE